MGKEMSLADIVTDPKDKKILEPAKKNGPMTMGTVISDKGFVRKEPDKYSDLLIILKKGKSVVVSGESGDYYKVSVDSIVGYIRKSKLSVG